MARTKVYLVQRSHGIWYAYYTDVNGKYKGKSLKTRNEREARHLRRQLVEELEQDIRYKIDEQHTAYLYKLYAKEIEEYERNPEAFMPYMPTPDEIRIMELENEIKRLKGIQDPIDTIDFSLDGEDANKPTPINTANPTGEEFWECFNNWALVNKKPSTVYSYKIAWEKLLRLEKPEFVLDITPEKIRRFTETLQQTDIKDKTIGHHLIALQTIFNYSIAKGFFTGTNPVPLAKKNIRLDVEASPKAKALSPEQFKRLLEIAKNKSRDIYLAVAIGGYSGLRKGEIANLRWEDIDVEAGTLSVTRKTADSNKGIVAWTAKTKSSYRTVQLFSDLKDILLIYKKPAGYVIEDTGINRAKWMLPKEFEEVRKELGVSWFTFHDLRHTFASLLLNQGIDIHVVAKLLGHASMQITYDTYFHMMPEMFKNVRLTGGNRK